MTPSVHMRTYTLFCSVLLSLALGSAQACPPPSSSPGHVRPSLAERLAESFKKSDAVFVAVVSQVEPTGVEGEWKATLQPQEVYKGSTDGLLSFEFQTKFMPCGHIQPASQGDVILYYVRRGRIPIHMLSIAIQSKSDESLLMTQQLAK